MNNEKGIGVDHVFQSEPIQTLSAGLKIQLFEKLLKLKGKTK